MNPKPLNLKWALAFMGATAVGAAGVVLVLALTGGRNDRAVAQPAEPSATPLSTPATLTPRDTVLGGPTIPPAEGFPVVVPTLPKGFTQGEKRACAEGWRRISDDMANYSFCLPPGWAMVDYETGQPRVNPIIHWESAAILSPEGFPYPHVGSYEKGVRDLIRDSADNVIWMQLLPFWSRENGQTMSCEPKPARMIGSLPSARCENTFNIPAGTDWAIPDANGRWGRLFVVVPLPEAQPPPGFESSPYPTPEGGYSFGLGIIFEGRNEALDRYRDLILQIVDTLEGQP
jgi:hypothetical protein